MQPGGSCAYCGQGIRNVAVVRSADGKVFDVGFDCAASIGDAGLRRAVDRAQQTLRAAQTAKRNAGVAEQLEALLADPRLASLPAPNAYSANLAEHARWLASRCGAAGRKRLVATLVAALGG